MKYEIVKAKTREEAIEASSFYIGKKLVVTGVQANANSDGTWTIFPIFEIDHETKSTHLHD